MYKTKDFNNIDFSSLIPEEHRLKRGKSAVFRLHGMRPDPERPGEWIIPNITGVPIEDRVVDDEGNAYRIAPIKGLDVKGEPSFHEITFTRQSFGYLRLSGNSPDDIDIFNYMYVSNYNATNENRDTTRTPIFEYVDDKANARKEIAEMDATIKAVQALQNMKKEDILDFAASRGMVTDDYDIAYAGVAKLATTAPNEFLAAAQSETLQARSVLNRALRRKVINYVAGDRKYVFNESGDSILMVPEGKKEQREGYLINWLLTNERGKTIYQHICDLLKTDSIVVE